MLDAIAAIGTALGVGVAAWQLHRNAQQARTDFEDEFTREYRALTHEIPSAALLGDELSDQDYQAHFKTFLRYVDMCNEQVFLRKQGRVSRMTWRQWCEGIQTTLAQPSYRKAWSEIKTRTATETFSELRQLEQGGYRDDPRSWVPWPKRLKTAIWD